MGPKTLVTFQKIEINFLKYLCGKVLKGGSLVTGSHIFTFKILVNFSTFYPFKVKEHWPSLLSKDFEFVNMLE
jgi:hypothetical protein